MEISGHGRSQQLASLLLGIQEMDRSSAKKPASPQAETDHIQISEHAKEIQRIKALAQAPDPARDERIAQIRQAVESGTYAPDTRATADALIRHVLTDAVL